MAERIPQSTSYLVVFRAFLASDGKTPATGKTIAITVSKNGSVFNNPAAGATNATEISSGFYKFTLDTNDTGTLGPVAWRGAQADINDAGDVLNVVAAIPVANVTQWSGGSIATPFASGIPVVNLSPTARRNTATAGGATSVTLDSGASSVTDFYKGSTIAIVGGTGAGQSAVCTAYNGSTKVATTTPAWVTNPDSTSVFEVIPLAVSNVVAVGGTAATVAGTVDANVVAVDGASLSTHTAGMFPDDLRNISGAIVSTSTAQLGVNIIQASGVPWGQGAITPESVASGVTADIFSGTALIESYAVDGVPATPAQLLYMIWSLLSERAISGTTVTCKKIDGSTTSMTFTLNSATVPTTQTRAT